MSEIAGTLEAALRLHADQTVCRVSTDKRGVSTNARLCTCGAEMPWPAAEAEAAHLDHLADVVRAWVAEVVAGEREAAAEALWAVSNPAAARLLNLTDGSKPHPLAVEDYQPPADAVTAHLLAALTGKRAEEGTSEPAGAPESASGEGVGAREAERGAVVQPCGPCRFGDHDDCVGCPCGKDRR